MSSTEKGHAAERKWMKRLQAQGWFACRPRWAGVDVIAIKAGEPVRFCEVKANKAGGPYMHFRSEERVLLSGVAEKAGAAPELVYWPPGQPEPRVIPEAEWPSIK